jgi:hypothetical protein
MFSDVLRKTMKKRGAVGGDDIDIVSKVFLLGWEEIFLVSHVRDVPVHHVDNFHTCFPPAARMIVFTVYGTVTAA